ncbi:MAG: patatin-like protein [Sphingomonas sp.]|uniref:patatin-like protein n=1 Tax=Sphingomonas sp. TaxID=28214 RepID=UPI001AD08E87|nr:patatin-like protein [Sphingomonas sp.]MBN8807308.1 patatin-like protein [Sphingomonas sp.]
MRRDKELRLALVCYGGISLAVYMHGITKEIWRLARASRAYNAEDRADNRPPLVSTEAVFVELFEEIAEQTDLRFRVLPDIIAGASAGGINGIFLAQAIATGQSLEPLTKLWLDTADVEALIDPDAAPSHRFSKAWALPIAWMAQRRGAASVDELVGQDAREEVARKLSHFVRSRWFEPPFGGAQFLNLILDAFDAMAETPSDGRLLPGGQPLDLFVTVTDFRGHPERLELNSPAEVIETEHRLVIPFSDHGGGTFADTAELTFAARATSSFPGAFPPFSVGELDGVLADRETAWPTRDDFLRRILPRQHAANAAEAAVLIDGSVLANAPFRPAIEALRERPARREIDRRFVYIDPSPGMGFQTGATAHEHPGFFQTIIGAISELPRQQPIRDNLEALQGRSARIERMRGITRAMRPEVEAEIESLFGFTLFLDSPTAARLAGWRSKAQNAAAAKAGYGYAGYGHLKIAGVIDLIATLLCAVGGETGADRLARIRAAVTTAVDRMAGDMTFTGKASPSAILFLRSFDLGFRIRRLRLVARRLTELEDEIAETDLAAARTAVYDALATYLEAKRTDTHADLKRDVRALRGDATDLLHKLARSLDLKRIDDETDANLAAAFAGMPREVKRPLLYAYLGFPFFDVASLPLLQGEGLDEFDPIKVDRIAPEDAKAIRAGGAAATLKGIQFNSFGAFFSRAYRENDYLWGRLHGVERLIDIIVSALPPRARMKPGRVAAIKRRAFHTILDEEEPRLAAVPGLIAALRKEVG